MKQKITIEANIWCDKYRAKAMVEDGVRSIAFKGPRRDQIEIIRDEVDAARLTGFLRKKLGHADLLRVEEITDKEVEKKKPDDDKRKESSIWGRRGCHRHHEMELHIYDSPSSGGCTIM